MTELTPPTNEYRPSQSELRIWAKLPRAVLNVGLRVLKPLRLLWPPELVRALPGAFRQARDGRRLPRTWVQTTAKQLVADGSLGEEEAEKAVRSMEAPETLGALGHLGAHIAISIVLFGPFEMIARVAWTVFFRLRAEVRALIRREWDETLRGARRVHTLTVALLSVVPFVGTFAYIMAEPLRKNRPLLAVLLDGGLRKLPFGLYQRQHLVVLTCWLAYSGPALATKIVKDRWHSLRPHHLVAWMRDSVEHLRPQWILVVGILAANIVALTVAFIADGLTGTLSGTVGEFGPMQTLKAGELLLAGVAGYYIYTRFWRLPQAEQRVDAPGSFFWILSGMGLVWLGLDDFFQIHERVGDLLEGGLGVSVPVFNNLDDLILLGYGIMGLALAAIFLGELMRSRAVLSLLAPGLGFLVISQGVDFFAPEGSALAVAENPTNIVGAGLLLSAYLVKLREVWGELPAVREPVLMGNHEQPVENK